MRPLLAILLLGFVSASCGNNLAPPGNLTGVWAADYHFPGTSLILNLTQPDGSVTGTGTYSIEAGRSGTLDVSGSYSPPHVQLSLRYDYGLTLTFDGAVLNAHQMVGTTSDSTGSKSALTFTHQ